MDLQQFGVRRREVARSRAHYRRGRTFVDNYRTGVTDSFSIEGRDVVTVIVGDLSRGLGHNVSVRV